MPSYLTDYTTLTFMCEKENQCLYTEAFISQDLNTVISGILLLLTKVLKLGQMIGFGARSEAADATIKHYNHAASTY